MALSARSGDERRTLGTVTHVEEAWQPCEHCVAGYLNDDSRRPCPDCDATGVVPG